jgi:hypothetical protein
MYKVNIELIISNAAKNHEIGSIYPSKTTTIIILNYIYALK